MIKLLSVSARSSTQASLRPPGLRRKIGSFLTCGRRLAVDGISSREVGSPPFTAYTVASNTRIHVELNGRPAVHCRNRFASLKRIQKSLDPENQGETPLGAAPFVDPMNVIVSFLSLHNLPSDFPVVDSQPFDSLLESKQLSMFHPSPPTVTLFSLP